MFWSFNMSHRQLLKQPRIGRKGTENTNLEPEVAERDAVPLKIPVRHGERSHRLNHPHKAVRLQHQFPINQAVDLRFARSSEENIGFRSFICEDRRGGAVGEATGFLSGRVANIGQM